MADTVVLDACCVINLAAADAFETWRDGLGFRLMLPEVVRGEALFLRNPAKPSADEAPVGPREPSPGLPLEPIVLDPYIDSGLLTLVDPDGEAELAAYVAYAQALDDGEAMALAIASSCGWALATDDRKAVGLADRAGVAVLTTPTLVKRWSGRTNADDAEIRRVLLAIRDRARFVPSGRDPLAGWWLQRLGPPA